MTEPLVVAAPALRRHTAAIVCALGGRPEDGRRVAEALVDADLCGHRSHGVRQLPYYADQVRRGEIDVASEVEVVQDTGALFVLDGHRGFGHVVAEQAVRRAIGHARRHGIATAAVRNANHIGRLGEYTEMVAGEGLVALLLVTAQGADQQVAPFGGIDRRLSNNPLSIAVPGPDHPIVLDIALSEAAESRVLHAADQGLAVRTGWLLDEQGRPTTDPGDYVRGGSLLPTGAAAGSHKGYSLIVALELVVGLLTGVPFCGPSQPPFSNAFVLIVVDSGEAAGDRRADVAGLIEWVHSSRRREGVEEILVPGELEARRRRAAAEQVTLDPVTVAQLDALAGELGLDDRLGGDPAHAQPAVP